MLNLQNIYEPPTPAREKPANTCVVEKESLGETLSYIAETLEPKIYIMPEVAKITVENPYIGKALGTIYEFDHKLSQNKDNYNHDIFRHSYMLANLSVVIGQKLNLEKKYTDLLIKASILHDHGKVDMKNAREILTRKGELETEEKKSHVIEINKLIHSTIENDNNLSEEQKEDLKALRYIIVEHHRDDGYWIEDADNTQFKNDENINKIAKLFAQIDKFEALISPRAYKEGLPEKQVRKILLKIFPKKEDEVVIDILFDCYKKLLKPKSNAKTE